MESLVCPRGHAGPFQYLEDVTIAHQVEGVDKYGNIILRECESPEVLDDVTTNGRLLCEYYEAGATAAKDLYCGAEFPLPDTAALIIG